LNKLRIQLLEPPVVEIHFKVDDLLDLHEKPGIDMCELVHLLQRESVLEGIADVPDALRPRFAEFFLEFLAVGRFLIEPVDAHLEPPQRLLE
jgi:hypothetical protein